MDIAPGPGGAGLKYVYGPPTGLQPGHMGGMPWPGLRAGGQAAGQPTVGKAYDVDVRYYRDRFDTPF